MIGWIKRAFGGGFKPFDTRSAFREAYRELEAEQIKRDIAITQANRDHAVARKLKRSHYDERLVALRTALLKLEQGK